MGEYLNVSSGNEINNLLNKYGVSSSQFSYSTGIIKEDCNSKSLSIDSDILKEAVKELLRDELNLDTVLALNYLRKRLEEMMEGDPKSLLDEINKKDEIINELRDKINLLENDILVLRGRIDLIQNGWNTWNSNKSSSSISSIGSPTMNDYLSTNLKGKI